jgi:hypothetical protein
MNTIKNIIVAATLSTLSLGYLTAAQAADTVKPSQGISFHAGSKDAVAYFLSESRTCKLVLTVADKDARPTRFEAAISSGQSTSYALAEGKALEFACQADAQAMTINSLAAVAAN